MVASQGVDTLVTTLVGFHLGTFVHITMQGLITVILTVGLLITHEMVVDTFAIVTFELIRGAGRVVFV